MSSKIFDVKPQSHLLAEAVRVILSNSRQGTAHTKTRGEVSGGGKKPWKQKGTGRARAGSIRSPIWRHGGITFGPRSNRNWNLKLNKKARRKALFMSLSDKAKSNQLVVIDKIDLEQPKTKEFVGILENFKKSVGSFGQKQLLLLPKKIQTLSRAVRNIPSLKFVLADSLNPLDVLRADTLLVLKDSLPVIEKVYLKVN